VAGEVSYFHEEQRFGWWVSAVIVLIAIAVFAGVVGTVGRGGDVGAAGVLATVAAVAALFALAKLVVDVDDRDIHVSFHYLWPTRHISLADVRRAQAMSYNALIDYGGWGVRFSPWAGWAYNTGGAEGVLVEMGSGARVMIGSRRAKELEEAIARAMAGRAGR
jgi:hypothetical protein